MRNGGGVVRTRTDPFGVNVKEFRSTIGRSPSGVAVVGGLDGGRTYGMAVASLVSLSLEPPLVLFCAATTSTSWPRIRAAGAFCASVLADDQGPVCAALAQQSDDKFRDVDWVPSPSGAPIVVGCLAWFDCAITAVHREGDHDIVVGQVTAMEAAAESRPLVYFRGSYGTYRAAPPQVQRQGTG
jgi:3-hydroxy-9,10-secoandrosta-1,3,5(10)-triene-9,17-dione monooxygenase reductase component